MSTMIITRRPHSRKLSELFRLNHPHLHQPRLCLHLLVLTTFSANLADLFFKDFAKSGNNLRRRENARQISLGKDCQSVSFCVVISDQFVIPQRVIFFSLGEFPRSGCCSINVIIIHGISNDLCFLAFFLYVVSFYK